MFAILHAQEKCIEYIHCFNNVNEMVYVVITIVNIPLILFHVFYRLVITIVVLCVFLSKFIIKIYKKKHFVMFY